MSPSPNRFHQVICRNLLVLLTKYLESHRVGEVFPAPSDVYLTEHDVYQPDLFFVSDQNAGVLTPQGASGAPDLVIEVLSPATARLDREIKSKVYAQAGVKELWLIDPELKTVEVHVFEARPSPVVSTHAAGSSFRSSHLPGLTIPLKAVFRPSRLG